MNVSLTERCYDLLGRESPVASRPAPRRLGASGSLGELERIGDLALRVVKLAPDHDLLAGRRRDASTSLQAMADEAVELFRVGAAGLGRPTTSSWPTALADGLAHRWTSSYEQLVDDAAAASTGPTPRPIAMRTLLAGQALERIADHAAIIGSPAPLPRHRRPRPPRRRGAADRRDGTRGTERGDHDARQRRTFHQELDEIRDDIVRLAALVTE